MKNLLILFLLGCTFSGIAQEQKSTQLYTNYSIIKQIDTFVLPDYFDVKLRIREFTSIKGKGRKSKYNRVAIDSVQKIAQKLLNGIGLHQELKKVSISKVQTNYYNANPFLTASFTFSVTTSDSAEILFNKFMKEFPTTALVSLIANPHVSNHSLNQFKKNVDKEQQASVRQEVDSFAKANDLIYDGFSAYSVNMYRGGTYYATNTNPNNLSFFLVKDHPKYMFNASYMVRLKKLKAE